jgi:ComF family protein
VLEVLPHLTKFKGAALNLIFPQKCLGCGEEGELLCRACQKNLVKIIPPICPRCGRPQSSGILCPSCVSWQASIDGIRSPLKFTGLTREVIHQLKYKNLRSLSGPLANLLKEYFTANPLPAEVLVPVPLHPRRLKERGYNQSSLLARELASILNLPVIEGSLLRVKFISPQARTESVEERHRNVKDAFECRDSRLQNRQVLLIDDVSTSGATLDACAQALKTKGARSVWGLVLAREI